MKFFTLLTIVFIALISLGCSRENRVVLVTGGAGYIGSHTCRVLKEAGYTPVTYDSFAQGSPEAVKWGPCVQGDLLEVEKLEAAFEEYHPVAVVHFAALRNVGDSVKDPSSYYTNNVMGSINLLNAMLKHHVKNIIFSSSCTVYGVCDVCPIDEKQVRAPTNPYAVSKYTMERMIEDFALAYGFKYMILRYFNAAGIDVESGLKRTVHSQSFLIPKAMLSILHPESPLMVFGTDYSTFDGTAIRDYIHVKDLAEAHLLALRYLEEGSKSEVINLGTGKGLSVFEIISAIEKVTAKKVPCVMMPRREGDVPEAVADTKKAQEILHFKPQFSDLNNIIESEWSSLKN